MHTFGCIRETCQSAVIWRADLRLCGCSIDRRCCAGRTAESGDLVTSIVVGLQIGLRLRRLGSATRQTQSKRQWELVSRYFCPWDMIPCKKKLLARSGASFDQLSYRLPRRWRWQLMQAGASLLRETVYRPGGSMKIERWGFIGRWIAGSPGTVSGTQGLSRGTWRGPRSTLLSGAGKILADLWSGGQERVKWDLPRWRPFRIL